MLLRAHYKQADEAGIRKAQPPIETPSVGIRLGAVFKNGSAHEPSQLARELQRTMTRLQKSVAQPPPAVSLEFPSRGRLGYTFFRILPFLSAIMIVDAATCRRCPHCPRGQ